MSKYFWIYGKHAIISCINNPNREIKKILYTENFDKNLIPATLNSKLSTKKEIRKLINNKFDTSDQNIIAQVKKLPQKTLKDISEENLIIILDKITDTRNIGSIIRTAVAFNVRSIVVNERYFNDTSQSLYKAASGATEHLNIIQVSNLSNAIRQLQKNNFWIYGLDVKTQNTISHKTRYEKKSVFILGSEDLGISKIVRENCDEILKIKINENIESLNVSNSLAAILMSYQLNNLQN